jgi:hypothetical protein
MTAEFPGRFDTLDLSQESAAASPSFIVVERLLRLFFSPINRKKHHAGEHRGRARRMHMPPGWT